MHDLTGSDHKIVHAYKVSRQGCKISRVRNTRSYMLTIYQDRAARSHGFGPTYSTCLQSIRSGLQDLTGKAHQIEPAYTVSGRGCRISRAGNYRSYMPTRHQEGTSVSQYLRTTDRTCLLLVGVRTALHDLTDSEHKTVHAYNVSGRLGTTDRTWPNKHQEGTSGSQGFETPDQYLVSGRRCMISRVRNTRSYMPRGYQEGAAGSHG